MNLESIPANYKNLNHTLVPKVWGYELWITNSEKYCGKLLHIVKGKQCSWHYHKLKDEVMYVQSGKLKITYGFNENKLDLSNSCIILSPGDSFHIPTGMIHQMTALETTELFEFSTQHFDEDSYRLP